MRRATASYVTRGMLWRDAMLLRYDICHDDAGVYALSLR